MSIAPIITFKAGKCEADFSVSPPKVKPESTPGYLYLYSEDDLVHFCWRARTASLSDPELDLVMVPTDGTFKPYLGPESNSVNGNPKSPLNGRIFVLKFSSSAQRHFFWLQSKEAPAPAGQTIFSARDLKLGTIVDNLLQGGDTDVDDELENVRNLGPNGDGDDDETMEDASHEPEHHRGGSGGAGADATGGDVREEGEQSRDGGADGGRANDSQDQTQLAIQNFINSLKGGQGSSAGQQAQNTPFTTLPELLTPATTLPALEKASASTKEDLLVKHLPPALTFLEHDVDEIPDESDPEVLRSMAQALSEGQQTGILRRVLRSPQFVQSLASLTGAIREGGLPSVCEALGIKVANGGYTQQGGRIPLTGGAAVEAFLNGIKDSVSKT